MRFGHSASVDAFPGAAAYARCRPVPPWDAGSMTEPVADAPAERYLLRQKLTMMVNRYEIVRQDELGKELGLLCFAEQKRMAAKEQVTFYTDSAKTHPLFGFKARKRIDLSSGYDVTDSRGQRIGWFKKQFKASLVNSTWRLGLPDGREFVGTERNAKVALVRRIWDVVPVVGDLPVPFLFHFDFAAEDGSIALTSTKKAGVKDVYHVTLPALADGKPIDWRVGMAMAVALDALQSR
ncbi:MAG: hypothetical protein JF622_07310 [Terrabacter sp.]|nr:hypothetical protein [Terrabacter sp.]